MKIKSENQYLKFTTNLFINKIFKNEVIGFEFVQKAKYRPSIKRLYKK